MRVYENQYLIMDYYEEHKLLELTWLPDTEFMSDEDYKQVFIDFMNTTIKYRSKLVLPDETHLYFPVIPSLQEWVNKNIFTEITKHKCNLYSAIVLRDDLIAQLAVEQLLKEGEAKKMTQSRFFTKKTDAKDWLLECKEYFL